MRKKIISIALVLCLAVVFVLLAEYFDLGDYEPAPVSTVQQSAAPATQLDLSQLPAYSGDAYAPVNDNTPYFDPAEYSANSFETYGALDKLGRCTVAFACVGKDLMPAEERGDIGSVKPTGWQVAKYDFVDGKYLYNRCHLIGFQLTGENANTQNLITGTRYMNVDGMLPFENMIADYVKETKNHVLYRVSPIFEGDNLVAAGVLMEAWSVEDSGEGICFNVFCYNNQPGVSINYADGSSVLSVTSAAGTNSIQTTYILNTNTRKFHLPDCSSIADVEESNRQVVTLSRDELIAQGYSPCGRCKP